MILYAISDRTMACPRDLIEQASALIRAGVDWLQIREKDLPNGVLYGVLKVLSPEARRFGARLLVNGRPDIALEAGASGVHLPAQGLPTAAVRAFFPSPFCIVRSCHSLEEVLRAEREGADAVTLGPIYPTPSKFEFGPPLGLAVLRAVCPATSLPVIALGGVEPGKLAELASAGAAGAAAIRMLWGMRNPLADFPPLRQKVGNTFDRPPVC